MAIRLTGVAEIAGKCYAWDVPTRTLDVNAREQCHPWVDHAACARQNDRTGFANTPIVMGGYACGVLALAQDASVVTSVDERRRPRSISQITDPTKQLGYTCNR